MVEPFIILLGCRLNGRVIMWRVALLLGTVQEYSFFIWSHILRNVHQVWSCPHFVECSAKVLLNVEQECWLPVPLLELHATFLILNSTSVACAFGPSVTTSSTDFFLPKPGSLKFIWIFSGRNHLKNQYLPHSESKSYQIHSIKSCSSRSFQEHQRHIPIPLKFSATI